ncbi:MAG: ribonuclease D [Pirellulales bacterium]
MSSDVITEQSELQAFCDRLRSSGRIAFDTEFVSEHTYRPQLCLVQCASDTEARCIDPLAGLDLEPLWQVLTDPAHEVIVHAARQEMLFALEASGRRLARLFDVQIAAGMVGMEFPAGYGNLISRLLNVVPQKGETRTDWRRRPLTDRQIEYGVADVQYLLPLYAKLTAQLEQLKRREWFAVEMEAFQCDIENSLTRERWRRVSGSSGMSSRCQAVLRELWTWRENEAERRDLPPRLILRDDLMVELAKRKVGDPKHIGAARNGTPGTAPRHPRFGQGRAEGARPARRSASGVAADRIELAPFDARPVPLGGAHEHLPWRGYCPEHRRHGQRRSRARQLPA